MSRLSLSTSHVNVIHELVYNACADSAHGLPCATVILVGDGQRVEGELLTYQIASSGVTRAEDTTKQEEFYWLASCTKLVTTIACMQLIESGLLTLDDAEIVERLVPELRDVQVLHQDGTLVAKQRRITLRMLLTHTAGFGYSFLNPALKAFAQQQDPARDQFNEFSGRVDDFAQPLVNQPGERFEYGISMDWAGILVERASGLKLNDYFSRSIFQPLGIMNLTMKPSAEISARCAGMWHRDKNGELSPREYPLRKPFAEPQNRDVFHSGGAGLYGSLKEYAKILQALLNNGASLTGQRILSAESVEQMFSNQLIDQPDFARQPLPTVKPDLAYPAPAGLYPLCPKNKAQGWGLGGMLTPSITGRSDGTMQWSGLSNIFWWCDREKGVAGIVGSQVLPFADQKVLELWVQVEQSLYAARNIT